MTTLISVDWDFFVPLISKRDNLHFDFGFGENLFFLTDIWKLRATDPATHEIECLDYKDFWSKLKINYGERAVSDSHLYVFELARYLHDSGLIDELVLVDAHHDIFLSGEENLEEKQISVSCGNWVFWLLSNCPLLEIHFLQADWAKPYFPFTDQLEQYPSLEERFHLITSAELTKFSFDHVHVCRSGCWTPPWLDKDFKSFITLLDSDEDWLVLDEDPKWSPLIERFNGEDLRNSEDLSQLTEELYK